MAKLSKKDLLHQILRALEAGGHSFHVVSRQHPFRILLATPDGPIVQRIYIWNLTHGGGVARPRDEYRIQITGTSRLEQEENETTIILGWWHEAEVFAAFDFRLHQRRLGQSPSIQIREEPLLRAAEQGLAFVDKGNKELAFAVRPDFLGVYLFRCAELHKFGLNPKDLAILRSVASHNYELSPEAEAETSKARRKVIVRLAKAAREADFRRRVINAYENKCALCGVQLRLLDAAHIVPVAISGSTDETNNGLALCSSHHRAYDQALVVVEEDYRISINEAVVETLKANKLAGGLSAFRANLRPSLGLPVDARDYPRRTYLRKGKDLRLNLLN